MKQKEIASEPFKGLTNAEVERLSLLLEELGETQQMIGKILRFGYENFKPFDPTPNRILLEKELGDVDNAIRLMIKKGDVDKEAILQNSLEKQRKIGRYLFFQGES